MKSNHLIPNAVYLQSPNDVMQQVAWKCYRQFPDAKNASILSAQLIYIIPKSKEQLFGRFGIPPAYATIESFTENATSNNIYLDTGLFYLLHLTLFNLRVILLKCRCKI